MRHLILALVVVALSGCSAKPDVPVMELAPDYVGELGGREIVLSLEQKGRDIEGQFMLENGDLIQGTVEGVAKPDGAEIKLKIPPAFVQQHRISPVIVLNLKDQDCADSRRDKLLVSLALDGPDIELKKPEIWRLLEGETTFQNYDKEKTVKCELLNVAFPGNVFNK